MVRPGRRTAGAAAAALLLCAPHVRAGEKAAERTPLATLLSAGADAAKAKQWGACVEALTAAAAIESNATTLGDLGLCEEQAGKPAAAHDHLRRALDGAPAQLKEPRKRYEAALDRVGQQVAILFVTVHPTGAAVVLDGRPLGVVDGRGIAVEPGTHTIAARLEGYEDEVAKRTFLARDLPSVHLQLKAKTQAPPPATAGTELAKKPPPPAAGSVPKPDAAAHWYQPALSFRGVLVTVTYASATAAMISSAVMLAAEVERGRIARGFTGFECGADKPSPPAKCADLRNVAAQRDTAVNVMLGTAAATVVAAGMTGLAIRLDRSPSGPAIAPSASSQGGGIIVFGAW